MNYTPEESGSLRPYDYTIKHGEGEEAYFFTTSSGTSYICYFLDIPGLLGNFSSIEIDVVTFGLSQIRESAVCNFNKHDPRIKETVFSILLQVIIDRPERLMFVMYDTKDGRQRNRKITFSRWYKEGCKLAGQKITKITIGGSSVTDKGKFEMMMLVPNTCSKLDQIKKIAVHIKDEMISKGYPPSLECRIECR